MTQVTVEELRSKMAAGLYKQADLVLESVLCVERWHNELFCM